MATYAVGDLQGCFSEFEELLERVGYRDEDSVWLVGDLINRGPRSLDALRYARDHQQQTKIVLGNHDLHFLAVYFGGHSPHRSDTMDELLAAPDVDELAHWLRRQPLIHRDTELGWTMVHAGLPPFWAVDEAIRLAGEVEAVMSGQQYVEFFEVMYGNQPQSWHPDLRGFDRLRLITNYLTRLRLLDANGEMNFSHKGELADAPPGLSPWFDAYAQAHPNEQIVFGHWAALDGVTNHANLVGLDTGCVWGRSLTAMCLETRVITQVSAH